MGKLALVLAGGGLTGAVYEIGALRAIDDLLVGRTVNDFDIYVGTSAGAIVASFLANGVSAEEMYQVIEGSHPRIPPLARQNIFNFNQGEFLRRLLSLPKHLVGAGAYYLQHLDEATLMDWLWTLSDVLPSGFYDGMALERYMRRSLARAGGVNDFRRLEPDLFVIATDLGTGERAVFSRNGEITAPVSLAVAASTALPMVYKPILINGREYIDGGMRGTASLDLAIEHGATLVVCVNPLVPYNNRAHGNGVAAMPSLSARGVPVIASQVSRITMHSGLRYQIKQLRRMHPEVDIILVEPRPNDTTMFTGNIMHYSARLEVARHGFESVTLDLAQDYFAYKQTLARHGVTISRRRVVGALAEIQASGFDPAVIHRVLSARSDRCAGADRRAPLCQLDETLHRLELEIEERASA
jgi:predicted acylesterase/phospholipase RssA